MTNPRSSPRHRERGPKRYTYTIEDVARLANRSVHTIHAHGGKISDLAYVVDLINRARARGR